jgi:hypothetical protein
MSRIILYYQDTTQSLVPIIEEQTYVSHVFLSSIHFGKNKDNSPYIHLNDKVPSDPTYHDMWEELKKVDDEEIKVVLMIGGAGGAFENMFSDFETYYKLLTDVITEHKFIKGINLDIEELVKLEDIKMLINRLDDDYGNSFEITTAPIQSSLEENVDGMGGFKYIDLRDSDEGKLLSYYAGQFYSNYSESSLRNCIINGYDYDEIVMGIETCQWNENKEKIVSELKEIYQDYGGDFGGVFLWDYKDDDNTKEWISSMDKIFFGEVNILLGNNDDVTASKCPIM